MNLEYSTGYGYNAQPPSHAYDGQAPLQSHAPYPIDQYGSLTDITTIISHLKFQLEICKKKSQTHNKIQSLAKNPAQALNYANFCLNSWVQFLINNLNKRKQDLQDLESKEKSRPSGKRSRQQAFPSNESETSQTQNSLPRKEKKAFATLEEAKAWEKRIFFSELAQKQFDDKEKDGDFGIQIGEQLWNAHEIVLINSGSDYFKNLFVYQSSEAKAKLIRLGPLVDNVFFRGSDKPEEAKKQLSELMSEEEKGKI